MRIEPGQELAIFGPSCFPQGQGRTALSLFLLIGSSLLGQRSHAQTPSPLQEWQYINALPLKRFFDSRTSEWNVVLGAGGEDRPLYEGSQARRFIGGPVVDIRFRDLAFISSGEGLGINLIRTTHLTAGFAVGYDFGRKTSDDEHNLRGLPNIARAPAIKAFADYVVSKEFPVVLRFDLRRSVGRGADGFVGDFSAYLPVAGSSPRLFGLVGPSLSWGSQPYLQKRFGITASESLVSPHPEFNAGAGVSRVGIGASATLGITNHWMLELNAATSWLLRDAHHSPLTQRVAQSAAALAISYRW